MLKYKINVLEALKEKGYSTYKLRKDNLLAQSTITKLNQGTVVSSDVLNALCRLLNCQPGDLIMYIADDEKTDTDDSENYHSSFSSIP